MIFNCEKCKALTPNFVNTATGKQLHQFEWIDDEEIGGLPLTWNWLADEYEYKSNVANIHYTLGGPWFNDAFRSDYEQEWIYYCKKNGGMTGFCQSPPWGDDIQFYLWGSYEYVGWWIRVVYSIGTPIKRVITVPIVRVVCKIHKSSSIGTLLYISFVSC